MALWELHKGELAAEEGGECLKTRIQVQTHVHSSVRVITLIDKEYSGRVQQGALARGISYR